MPESHKHRKTVGGNIYSYRKQAKLTLEKLAEKADMDWSYLGQVEKGRENISIDKLARLAKGLGVTISDLIKGA